MKFNIGDRVLYKHNENEIYEGIVAFINEIFVLPYLIKFEKEYGWTHNGECKGYKSDKKDCYWCKEEKLTLIEKATPDLEPVEVEIPKWIIEPSIKIGNTTLTKIDSGGFVVTCDTQDKEIKYKGENEMELLEIYKNRKMEEIEKECKENIKKLEWKDEINLEIKEFEILIKQKYDLKDFEILSNTSTFTDETTFKIHKEEDNMTNKKRELRDLISEVEAQIKLCETYEQKIDVLVNYGVIDKKTKKVKV